jgi:hypothetical protein
MKPSEFPYVYFYNRVGRKGQFCRILVRGKRNSCCVEFEDGYTMVTSRYALRRREPKVEGDTLEGLGYTPNEG